MAIVAGVDFGTLSVRVTLLDSIRGRLGTASAEYPLARKREDPDYATQSHTDQMRALVEAMRRVLAENHINGHDIAAIALDTTGSSVIPVDSNLQPLDDYYLWCDHRAHEEARQITELALAENLEAIHWCGDVYSHEWGFAKLLHWLRHNPELRPKFVTALEHFGFVQLIRTAVGPVAVAVAVAVDVATVTVAVAIAIAMAGALVRPIAPLIAQIPSH